MRTAGDTPARERVARALLALAAGALVIAGGAPPASGQTVTIRGVEVTSDVAYGTAGGQTLLMDVYRPSDPGPHPGILLVHGGGFHLGDKRLMRPVGLFLAQNGYVAFSISYRLAPRFAYPAAVEDAGRAVAFMRANAATYGVDTLRMGALGGSAGATLVASLGMEQGWGRSGSKLMAVASWSGIMDMYRFVRERPGQAGIIGNYLYGPSGGPLTEDAPRVLAASPVSHVGPGDPPMFIANSVEEAIPYDQAQVMVDTFMRTGVPVEQFTPSHGHSIVYFPEAKDPSLAFLNRYVRDYRGNAAPSVPPRSGTLAPLTGRGGWDTPVVVLAAVGCVMVLLAGILLVVRRRT